MDLKMIHHGLRMIEGRRESINLPTEKQKRAVRKLRRDRQDVNRRVRLVRRAKDPALGHCQSGRIPLALLREEIQRLNLKRRLSRQPTPPKNLQKL